MPQETHGARAPPAWRAVCLHVPSHWRMALDVEVEKHHYRIAALLDTKTQTHTYVLLLQKTVRVEKDTILEKVYKTLQDPGKKLDIAVKSSCTERCCWCRARSRLKGLEMAPALCHQFTLTFLPLHFPSKGEDQIWNLSLM